MSNEARITLAILVLLLVSVAIPPLGKFLLAFFGIVGAIWGMFVIMEAILS